jgi:hypothetical protein
MGMIKLFTTEEYQRFINNISKILLPSDRRSCPLTSYALNSISSKLPLETLVLWMPQLISGMVRDSFKILTLLFITHNFN